MREKDVPLKCLSDRVGDVRVGARTDRNDLDFIGDVLYPKNTVRGLLGRKLLRVAVDPACQSDHPVDIRHVDTVVMARYPFLVRRYL